MKTYIGIDPGLKGGIVSLAQGGTLLEIRTMPTVLYGRRKTVDICELSEILVSMSRGDEPTVIIESAQKFSAGTNALTSTWFGFGRITALLEIQGYRHEIVAAPRTWQKVFWTKPKMPKGEKFDTKAASISAAKRLFPGCDFLPTARCSVPADGLTDAALIAEYGRRLGL